MSQKAFISPLSVLLSIAISSPFAIAVAYSQTVAPPAVQPPIAQTSDVRGISFTTGLMSFEQPQLSAAGWVRAGTSLLNASGYGFFAFAPYIDSNVAVINYQTVSSSDYRFVSYAGSTEAYLNASAQYQGGTLGSRNRVVCSNGTYYQCSLILKDGTQVRYTSENLNFQNPGISAWVASAFDVTKPDGELIKYKYWKKGSNIYLSSVSSSLGWTTNYDYSFSDFLNVTGKITIINNSYDYCPASPTQSSNSSQWACTISAGNIAPTLSYAVTSPNTATHPEYKIYDYDGSLVITVNKDRIKFPSGKEVVATYSNSKVSRVSIGDKYWNYSYSGAAPAELITTVTDAYGSSRVVRAEALVGRVTSDQDELGRTTKYTYNGLGLPENVISPEATYSGATLTGGYTHYEYDGNRNVIAISIYPKGGGTPLTTSYTYEEYCLGGSVRCYNQVASVTDPNGNTTGYTYSHDHGGLLTVTSPPDQNGVSAQVRYTYSLLTPLIRNSSGVTIPSTPVYRVTQISTCKSSTSSCTGTSDEVKTFLEYDSAHNLLLKSKVVASGDANIAQPPSNTNVYTKVVYTYNYAGFLTSTDGPRTDVDDVRYTTYDHMNRPVFEIGPDPDATGALKRAIVRHWYDSDGREYRTEQGTGSSIDGSDFTVSTYTLTTFDIATGMPIKSVVATP